MQNERALLHERLQELDGTVGEEEMPQLKEEVQLETEVNVDKAELEKEVPEEVEVEVPQEVEVPEVENKEAAVEPVAPVVASAEQ